MTDSLAEIVARRKTLIICGSGGVGKTTTAAVLAMRAARLGRSAVVVTIDPARRLAQALGLEELGNVPRLIEPALWDPGGRRAPGGQLSAVMLDAKSTFDNLVVRYASGPEQAERILANTFYRNISSALSGTQEYMAMEKLYELHEEGENDFVVVDTPPSRNALDFLEAPDRVTRFLEGRVFRILAVPARKGMKVVNRAARLFLRTVSRVVGSEVLEDLMDFFAAFEGMYEGFHDRAARVRELLDDPGTAFCVIASPRRDALAEAEFFAQQLGEMGHPVSTAIVNRMHPSFVDSLAEATRLRAATMHERGDEDGEVLADLYQNLAAFQDVAAREDAQLGRLRTLVAPAPVEKVPFLGDDVHDFATLQRLEENLFPDSVSASGQGA
ncbi:MAG: ArsA family ATPase [Actinobacteria bacterium ATB1]|nr:ArsA family ATPase [Actinobacteria bacterium ATB1]